MKTDLKIEEWPIDRLIAYAKNARTHSIEQVDQVAASISEFGWTNPILVGSDRVIIAGHARWAAARKLKMAEVPVIVLGHLTDTQRRALVLADNRLAQNAGWNEDLLYAEMQALQEDQFDLGLCGFTDEEMAAAANSLQPCGGNTEEDAAPAPDDSQPAITAPGDTWLLGEHRLLCGDATVLADVRNVLTGGTADLVFTDPPYNVAYVGKTAEKLTIENDALKGRFYEFLRDACANMLLVSGGAIYICMSSSELHTLYKAFVDAGGHWSTFVIWAKHHFTLGRSDYQRMYEPILYGWREGASHYWCGDRNQGDVWPIKRPMANLDHPTTKPVELVEKAIHNSSKLGGVVFDPFAGSGTTIIACHKTGRRARLMELDPKYCDVVIRRWVDYTGGSARTAEGKTWPTEKAAA